MTTAEASTRLRFLHNEWWQALISKRPAAAEYWAMQIREIGVALHEATVREGGELTRTNGRV